METATPRVRLTHLWEATDRIWPEIPPRSFRKGRCTPESDKRAAFVLACKGFGFTHVQIGKFINRERSTVLHAECVAMERRETDSDYGAAICRIRDMARDLAKVEAANIPAPPSAPAPPPRRSRAEAFATDAEQMMRDGSQRLLLAIVRYISQHHPQVVAASRRATG